MGWLQISLLSQRTITMPNRLIKLLLLLQLTIFSNTLKIEANTNQLKYHLNVDLGLGAAMYFTDIDYDNQQNAQLMGTLRIMWEPEHLVRIGLETGFIHLYYIETKVIDSLYGSTDAVLNMSSVPIMAVFAMEVTPNFEIIAGVGGFILTSEVISFDNRTVSSSWSNAYVLGMSYLRPYTSKLQAGVELKSYYISRLQNYDLALLMSIKYSMLSF